MVDLLTQLTEVIAALFSSFFIFFINSLVLIKLAGVNFELFRIFA